MESINETIMKKLCSLIDIISSKEDIVESLKNFIHNLILFIKKTFNSTTIFCIFIFILIVGVLIYWYNWSIYVRTNKIIKNIEFYQSLSIYNH